VPVISTIPQRVGYEVQTSQYNAALRGLATENLVPLWDYAAALDLLQGGGLSADGVHPSVPPIGSVGAARFTPESLQYGFTVRNLTALQALDAVRRTLG